MGLGGIWFGISIANGLLAMAIQRLIGSIDWESTAAKSLMPEKPQKLHEAASSEGDSAEALLAAVESPDKAS